MNIEDLMKRSRKGLKQRVILLFHGGQRNIKKQFVELEL